MEEFKYRQIFDSAIYIDNSLGINVSERQLNERMKKDKQIYKKLKDHLFCPQCKKAKLAIAAVSKTDNNYFL